MKLNIKILSLIPFFVGTVCGIPDYLKDVKRAEIFEKTDFVIPKMYITLSDEDYKNFNLLYECDMDTNLATFKRNDKCYTASWINLDEVIKKSFDEMYISLNTVSHDDLMTMINGNITFTDFESMVSKYSKISMEKFFCPSYGLVTPPSELDIKIDGKMTFDVDGEVIDIPKIQFSIGGNTNSRKYKKLSYNIKIKDGELLGRKNLRLRSFTIDPSFLRDKLGNDIANAAGLNSLSSNFVKLYINGVDMGLYGFRDAYKSQWVKAVYGEEKTKNLYVCGVENPTSDYFNCKNNDDEITDMKDFVKFQYRIAKVKTREELDTFFDTKTFMKWHAVKSLFYAWDNLNPGHNSYLYKTEDGIWTQLVYDFDNSFGSLFDTITPQLEYYDKSPLLQFLNIDPGNEEYKQILTEVLEKAFNPKKLIPYIDDLVAFLDPYVKEDRTLDANGHRPGRFERPFSFIENDYTYEDFRNNSEFVRIKKIENAERKDNIYGLKQWILERFLHTCKYYQLDCSFAKEYAEDILNNATIDVYDYGYKEHGGCEGTEYNCCVNKYKKSEIGSWKVEFDGIYCLVSEEKECWSKQYGYECCKTKDPILIEPHDKTNPGTEWYAMENSQWCGILNYPYEKEKECWSSIFGYPCCEPKNNYSYVEAHSYLPNKYYAFENGQWCGIVDYKLCDTSDGYKCCSSCDVYYVDDSGNWGYENDDWCHTPSNCN